jgi:hypothetical protein
MHDRAAAIARQVLLLAIAFVATLGLIAGAAVLLDRSTAHEPAPASPASSRAGAVAAPPSPIEPLAAA